MAIYHLKSGFVSRSTGRSAVQSAAYITGEKLHEDRRNLDVNYRNRHSDIAFTNTLAPEYAPDRFHTLGVWNLLENFEDDYAIERFPRNLEARDKYLNSAQTAQVIVVALPRELSVEVSKELVEEFAKERFVSRGLIVTYAVHDDEGNPHAHVQISRRAVNEKGELSWAKDRDIVTKKSLLETRKLWADLTNQYLEREGFDERITEKSFAALGIELEPSKHRGWVSDKLDSMGISSRIVHENAEIIVRNKEVLLENPSVILTELTTNNATFTQMNLLKAIQKRVGDDALLVGHVFEGALKESIVAGEGINGEIRYTSKFYQEIEAQAVANTGELFQERFTQPAITQEKSQEYIREHFSYLSSEQQEAALGLTKDHRLSLLIGRAGAGKTTTLKAVSEIYSQAGHRVLGASLSAMAADNLGKETGIESHTLHSWLFKWERYQEAQEKFLSFNSVMEEGVLKQLDWYKDLKRFEDAKLTKDTVLIVDEAGMIGTRQWGELLTHVRSSGAKLIAVGDDNQFKAIEAGDFFRELKAQGQKHGEAQDQAQNNCVFELQEIKRQRQDWMKEASYQLAQLNTQEALSAYEQRGHIHAVEKDHLAEDIASSYVERVRQGKEGLVLAFTNEQVKELNQAIREQLKAEYLLNQENLVSVNGYSFSLGEKIVFLQNDKQTLKITNQDGVIQDGQYIKNGTRGTIASISRRGDLQITLQDGYQTIIPCQSHTPKVAIGQEQADETRGYAYTNIAPGYAVTTHKSQGQTVDFSIVAASKNIDAKGLYVAMTRHREDVQVFYAKEDFRSFKDLSTQLSRYEPKDLVKDYTIRPENEAAWQRVQEYKLCSSDAAAALHQDQDWGAYRKIKQDQVRLGREILKDFGAHKLYVNQAGLNSEMLEITAGYKARPLSVWEEKAKLTVELYTEHALLAREYWKEIRKTHTFAKCYEHELYKPFKEAQEERNALAHEIAQNYSLHREFVVALSREYGINKQTVIAQSKQFLEKQSYLEYEAVKQEYSQRNLGVKRPEILERQDLIVEIKI